MRIHYQCLPCLINQAVRVAELTDATDRDALFRKVFAYLSTIDFECTNPEIIGGTFRLLKQHTGNPDPYRDTRRYYNDLLSRHATRFEQAILAANDPFAIAVRYAILGNIIDFSPAHSFTIDEVLRCFDGIDHLNLTIDHVDALRQDILRAKTLLYLGDNCGEIVLDKLLLQQIRRLNPDLQICFGVRGEPIVNDSIAEDAYAVGIDRIAAVISNGDDSQGTVLSRCSAEFLDVYRRADVVIAKGQANYECLSEETGKTIYLMLMTKCSVIAQDVGVPEKSLVCMRASR